MNILKVMISTEKAHFPSGVLYGLCMCTQSWYDLTLWPQEWLASNFSLTVTPVSNINVGMIKELITN